MVGVALVVGIQGLAVAAGFGVLSWIMHRRVNASDVGFVLGMFAAIKLGFEVFRPATLPTQAVLLAVILVPCLLGIFYTSASLRRAEQDPTPQEPGMPDGSTSRPG